MLCPKCDTWIPDESRRCPYCNEILRKKKEVKEPEEPIIEVVKKKKNKVSEKNAKTAEVKKETSPNDTVQKSEPTPQQAPEKVEVKEAPQPAPVAPKAETPVTTPKVEATAAPKVDTPAVPKIEVTTAPNATPAFSTPKVEPTYSTSKAVPPKTALSTPKSTTNNYPSTPRYVNNTAPTNYNSNTNWTPQNNPPQSNPYNYSSAGRVSKVLYCILAFFLGTFGAHKFYAKKFGGAIVYLIMSLCGWYVIPIILSIYDIYVAVKKPADAYGYISFK